MTQLRDQSHALIFDVTKYVADRPLDAAWQAGLNGRFPAGGQAFAELVGTCLAAIGEGWMCEREAGAIEFVRP